MPASPPPFPTAAFPHLLWDPLDSSGESLSEFIGLQDRQDL